MFKRRQNSERGFTVIEMAITTSLLLIIMGFAGDFLITAMRNEQVSLQRDTLSRQTRFAIDDLDHDIRQANTSDPSVDPVTSLAATSFTFYSPDRQSPYHLRKISYQMSGTNLQRSVTTSSNTAPTWTFPATSAWVTVVPNVQSFAVTYKDASGAVTTFSSKVQRVEIAMTVDNDPAHSPLVQTYNLTADLRVINV